MNKLINTILALLCLQTAFAQSSIKITGGLKVGQFGPLYVGLAADSFANQGTYTDTGGTVQDLRGAWFSGTGQTMFNNFTINNSRATTLANQVSVKNTATLAAGSLAAGSGNLFIRTDLANTASLSVTGLLTGTAQGLIAKASLASGTCPLSTTLSTNVGGPVVRYQWQSSADNTTFADIAGATSATYAATVSANTYYRSQLSTTNTGYSQATASVLVTVSGGVTVGLSPSTAICFGNNSSLVATGGSSYSWSPSASLSSPTGASVTASPTVTTTYSVVVTSGGCSNAATVTVSVNALPSISAGATVAICNGSSTNLTATGGTTYLWSPTTGLGTTTGASVVASPTVTTTYSVTGSNGICSNIGTVTVTVNPAPAPILTGVGDLGIINTIAGTGNIGFSGDGGPATNAEFTAPMGICKDGRGNTYITDETRLRKINAAGIISTFAGNGSVGNSGNGGPATAATFGNLIDVKVDGAGNIYVVDRYNNNVRKIDTAGIISAFAGTGTYGYSGNNGPATSAMLAQPSYLAIDGVGNVFIIDNNYYIRKVSTSGIITTVAGLGYNGYSGDGGPATNAAFNNITSMAFDSIGNLYITDYSNKRIRKIAPSGIVTTFAGNGNYLFSTPGFGGPATAAEIFPFRLTIDRNGNTYFTQYDRSVYKISTVGIFSIAIDGHTGLRGDGGPASAAGLSALNCYMDSENNMYIVDENAGRYIRKISTTDGSTSLSVCSGASGTLTNAVSGGTWASAATGVATIGSTTGVVTGVAAGTAVISYVLPTGCPAVMTVTVNPLPASITGSATVCESATTNLANAVAGGTWSSSTPVIATIGTTGTVSGVSAGTATITYTMPCGIATFGVTVNPLPTVGGISGPGSVCEAATITLSNTTIGGAWASSSANASIIGGTVTGVTAGAAIISYTVTNGCGSNMSTKTITINPLPIAGTISGASSVCEVASTVFTPTISGGAWSSSSGITAIGGTITGVSAGNATISYSITNGCGTAVATATIAINPLPDAGTLSGPTDVIEAASITLSASVSGGVWSSSNIGNATVSGGVVTGIIAGTTVISYTITNGCGAASATSTININSALPAITGPSVVCTGNTITLLNDTLGGIWTSSNPTVADIGSVSGLVNGLAAGTATITYANTSGFVTHLVVVAGGPSVISGPSSVCVSQNINLNNSVPSGLWSSNNPTLATVGSATGLVTGAISGIVTISYTIGIGCFVTKAITINALSPITGSTSVCVGQTTTLNEATSGGNWTSSDYSVATVGSATAVVTGVAIGANTITYTSPAGCIATAAFTVNALSAITGAMSVCVSQTTTLGNAVSGGIWSSSNNTMATIGSLSGIVYGVANGSIVATYTTGAGCIVTTGVTINALSPITGASSVCVGQTTTLSEATSGGRWSSSDDAIASIGSATAVVTGVALGTNTITYTSPAGCVATAAFTVNALSAITGAISVCVNQTTILSNLVSGGIWTSSNTTMATIGSLSGIAFGVANGSVIVSYTTGAGCLVTTGLIVNPLSPITGASSVCVGQFTTFNNAVSGGTWSSSDGTLATIDASTGVVSGISGGTVTISYTTPGGCVVSTALIVNALAAISGATSVCVGQTTTITNTVSGGLWTSGNTLTATIGSSTGIINGVSGGSVSMTYTTGAGCVVTFGISSNASAPITGGSAVCTGQLLNLSNGVTGGAWSSNAPTIATIGSNTGQVTGLSAGTATISYLLASGCLNTSVISVNALGPITGPTRVCNGQTVTLSNGTPGGAWTTNSTLNATVNSTTGDVTGAAAGTVVISYTLGIGCRVTYNFTVGTISAIGGTASICGSQNTILTDVTSGGTWSSSNISVASVGSTGIVTGAPAGGVATITYSTGPGCFATKGVTVTPFDIITGFLGVCVGQTITLANARTGGLWSSSNPTAGTISSVGIVTGRAVGTTTISYNLSGCRATKSVNISVLGIISGILSTCVRQNTNLSNSGVGGLWSSSNAAIGSVISNTGAVTGVSAGSFVISYAIGSACVALQTVTVHPLDLTTGPVAVCTGQQMTLANTTAGGGTWTSGNTTKATIGASTGLVNGVTGGTVSISFTTPLGCRTTYGITVNTLSAITGTTAACEGLTSNLTNPGLGTWTSSDVTVATVGSTTAVVTGVSTGTATISFIVNTTGCTTTTTFTVHPYSIVISGSTTVCISAPITLTNTVSGGTWNVTSTAVATINATTGVTTAVGNSTTNVTYTTPRGCKAIRPLTSSTSCRTIGGVVTQDILLPEVGSAFTLIPNPNNGEFTIKGTFASGKDEEAAIEVVDILGQVVYRAKATATSGVLNEQVQINGTLANGMYLLNLHSDNENKVFHFVVKQ